MPKYVYSFGSGKADGNATMRTLLGGKGANLHEMSRLGISVPAGFTISIEACKEYSRQDRTLSPQVKTQVTRAIKQVEKAMGTKFGNPKNPLLLSVRSGAAVSMPGMMDTVLNLGLNEQTVRGLIRKTGNERLGLDSYRRFISMFGNVVMGIDGEIFEHALDNFKKERGATHDTDLSAEDLQGIVERFRGIYREHTKNDFPEDPLDQLWQSVGAVFSSWNVPRAIAYRKLKNIPAWVEGTAANVQAMVFGNMGETSGTGVCFSRNPSTGENYFYGEYLVNAQGEDVVAGTRTAPPISKLAEEMPQIYSQLEKIKNRLEKHYRDMQDMEFTIQEGRLFLLQTRIGERTAAAAVKIAVDLENEGLISKTEAIMRVQPDQLDQLLHPLRLIKMPTTDNRTDNLK